MKKNYLKPDVEYIDLISAEAITGGIIGGDMSTGELPEDWE